MRAQKHDPVANSTEVHRYFRRNYLAHSIEGGLYMGGLAFLAAETVLPAMVKSLGGADWLVSLMPMMLTLGIGWPSLLTAHWVEQMPRVKPFILTTGFLQRLPYLMAGVFLLRAADLHPLWTLFLVATAPIVSGLITGLNFAAWMQLISRAIPEDRRSSAWAIRWILAACIGIGAGRAISLVLERFPGTTGYGILHLAAFSLCMLSFALQATLHEVRSSPPPSTPPHRLAESLARIPELLSLDRRLRDFLCARSLSMGLYVVTPFLSIHALSTLGKDESYLGVLVMWQMAGGILGNILAGYLGDRGGGRLPMILARSLFVTAFVAVALNRSQVGFMVIFFLFGAAFYLEQVGSSTLSVDICPQDRIPTYISLVSAVTSAAMLIAAALSTALRDLTTGLLPAAFVSAGTVALSSFFLVRLKDPRRMRPQAASCGE